MCRSEVVVFDDRSLTCLSVYTTQHTWQCENQERFIPLWAHRECVCGMTGCIPPQHSMNYCWNFSGERGAHTSSSIHCCELMGPAPTKKMTRHDQHIFPSKVSIIIAPIRRRTLAASTRLIAWKNILFTFSYTAWLPQKQQNIYLIYYLLLFEQSSSLFLSSWWSMGTGDFAYQVGILLLVHRKGSLFILILTHFYLTYIAH